MTAPLPFAATVRVLPPREQLARDSRDNRKRAARRVWGRRFRLQFGSEGRVLVLVKREVRATVLAPVGRPTHALDTVGWLLWEARLLHAVATAQEEREPSRRCTCASQRDLCQLCLDMAALWRRP